MNRTSAEASDSAPASMRCFLRDDRHTSVIHEHGHATHAHKLHRE
jgi:hypothetical protein